MFVTALSITCIQQCCKAHPFIRYPSHRSNPTSTSAENRFNTRPVGLVSLMQQLVIEQYSCCKKCIEKTCVFSSKSQVLSLKTTIARCTQLVSPPKTPFFSAEFPHPPLEGFVKCTIQGICLEKLSSYYADMIGFAMFHPSQPR